MKKEELLYDLIFSKKEDFIIDISEYIENIYDHKEFVDEIKSILKKSKVNIIKSDVILDLKTATWKINIKK
tara:strand:- start:2866 stop:3078 length:213 start_codon:yes stop_codon:yes gene_type:complete